MNISKELRIEFNKRFANGEQYIEINQHAQDTTDHDSELAVIETMDRNYYWEQRAVYNKILPTINYFENKCLSKYSDISDKLKQEWEQLIYGENGLVERLIPLQKEYNNIRNRKNEFIDRLSFGTIFVEDGSVDLDELSEDGIAPGRIVVYRQGSVPPTVADSDITPYTVYSSEIETIEKDFERVRLDFQNNCLGEFQL